MPQRRPVTDFPPLGCPVSRVPFVYGHGCYVQGQGRPGRIGSFGSPFHPSRGPAPSRILSFPSQEQPWSSKVPCFKLWSRHHGKIQAEPSGGKHKIYFLDRVLAHQDELSLQRLGIHCRTTNILRLQSLYSPNFFNDFFFLKYRSWLYRDIARNHRRGCPSCSLTRSPVSFTSVSFSGFSFLEVAWRPGHAC